MKAKGYIEIIISYFLAIVVSYLVYKKGIMLISIPKMDTLFSLFVTIVVTIIGFLITSITILISLIDKKIIKRIIKFKMWGRFIYFYIEPLIFGILLMVACLVVIFVSDEANVIVKNNIIVLSFLTTMFTVGVLRLAYMLFTILRLIAHEDDVISYNSDIVTLSSPDDAFSGNPKE